jgi:hypothetical protein
MRVSLLGIFALWGSQGFTKSFSGLLLIAAIFCLVSGAVRRETLLGPILTNWDEAAAYLLIVAAARALT